MLSLTLRWPSALLQIYAAILDTLVRKFRRLQRKSNCLNKVEKFCQSAKTFHISRLCVVAWEVLSNKTRHIIAVKCLHDRRIRNRAYFSLACFLIFQLSFQVHTFLSRLIWIIALIETTGVSCITWVSVLQKAFHSFRRFNSHFKLTFSCLNEEFA